MRPLAIVLIVLLVPDIAMSAVSFGPPTIYPLPGVPVSLAVADFDRDGDVDVVCARQQANLVTLFSNNGSGTLSQAQSYGIGSNPHRSAVGLLNDDSFPDIVVTASDELMIMFNDQLGGFTVTHYLRGGIPFAVAIGDFNEDGMQDIALADGGNGFVFILTNRGSNAFEETWFVPGGGTHNYTGIVAADFNEDGHLDLVAAGGTGRNVRLIGAGDGTFTFSLIDDPEPRIGPTTSVVASDLDGDTHVDLATGVVQTSTIHFVKGNGDGTFEAPLPYATSYNPNSVTLADMDRNGTQDLLATHSSQGLVSVLLNDGLGAFTGAALLPTKLNTSCVRAGDINNDGWPDVIAGIAFGDELNVFLNESGTTGVGEGSIADRRVTLSPNPVRRGSGIELRGLDETADVSLFDVAGRSLQTQKLSPGRTKFHLPHHLAAGVYTVQIDSKGRRQSRRIVVLP